MGDYNHNFYHQVFDDGFRQPETKLTTGSSSLNFISTLIDKKINSELVTNYQSSENFVTNLLCNKIVLKSLSKCVGYEEYEIKRISLNEEGESEIYCKKEIGVEYVREILNKSELLIEIDMAYYKFSSDNYKEEAVQTPFKKRDRILFWQPNATLELNYDYYESVTAGIDAVNPFDFHNVNIGTPYKDYNNIVLTV